MNSDLNGYKSNAAAYIRVSTEDQTEYSPDAQLRIIKKYCNDKKISLIEKHIYRDAGVILGLINSNL